MSPERPSSGHSHEDEHTFQIVEEALYDLWTVVNDLSRIRQPRLPYYRVTIFGSARMRPGDSVYLETVRLARELSALGCDIVTGGGPGVMQAANEGAQAGDPGNRTRSFGLRIELPTEEQSNPYVEKVYRHRTFFSRLHQFVRLSSAFVVMRGGIGTTLETMLIWQLLQVRHIHDIPLIFVGEMWHGLVEWARTYMLREEPFLASPPDLEIPICVDSVDEALQIIRPHLERFNTATE